MPGHEEIKQLYVEYTHKNCLDEAILMSTHNKHFHDKVRKFP